MCSLRHRGAESQDHLLKIICAFSTSKREAGQPAGGTSALLLMGITNVPVIPLHCPPLQHTPKLQPWNEAGTLCCAERWYFPQLRASEKFLLWACIMEAVSQQILWKDVSPSLLFGSLKLLNQFTAMIILFSSIVCASFNTLQNWWQMDVLSKNTF